MKRLRGHNLITPFWVTLASVLLWWVWTKQSSRNVQHYRYQAPEDAHWITTSDPTQHVACFRKQMTLPNDVKHAYLSIAHNGGFELVVNGNHVGAQTLWRPTRHFQNGLTDSGQRLSKLSPVIVYNFPRDYQWVGHTYDSTILHFDLTPHLQSGENTICLEALARHSSPSLIAFGEIRLKNDEVVTLQTDTSWLGEPVPPDGQQTKWQLPTYIPKEWGNAIKSPHQLSRDFTSSVPPLLFTHYQDTRWNVCAEDQSQSAFLYSATFTVDNLQEEVPSFLKVLTYNNHWIWVNGQLLQGGLSKKASYNGGEWSIKWQGRRPLATLPVLLDPDENANFFGGDRYATPSHGDPTVNDFRQFTTYLDKPSTYQRIKRASRIESDTREEQTKNGGMTDPYGYYEEVNVAVPHTVLRPQLSSEYQAYDIKRLLRQGENTLTLRLVNELSHRLDVYGGSKPTRFAVSGMASGTSLHSLEWMEGLSGVPVAQGAVVSPTDMPALSFMGGVDKRLSSEMPLYIFLCFCGCYILQRVLTPLRVSAMMVSLTLTLALMLQWVWAERSEYLWTHTDAWKQFWIGGALLTAFLANFKSRFFREDNLKKGGVWICLALLLLTFFVRAWKVELQPIDDDEFASIQAILSIAETGVPSIGNDEIWYSRSPAYHYLVALFVKLFGENIWSLRLYSVLLSVFTGLLVWQMVRVYLKSYWAAHVSLLLFALHPFLIFSGHVARFYQQQQLFVLLMLHFFIMGFLLEPSQRWRNGAILLFTCAVLSQEISIGFVPVFLILYLLFGRGVPWRWELRSVLYLILSGLLIVTDIVLFKVKCMTRPVGVSPNVEATLAPTFWELGNLFTMFIGYSRLHALLSVFYGVSLCYAIRKRSSRLMILHASLVVSIVSFNFLITSVSFRYLYSLIPLWIILGVHGMLVTTRWVVKRERLDKGRPIVLTHWVALFGVLLSFSVWRIPGAYQRKLLGDSSTSLAYVRQHLRPDDKVMITEPHPHAALVELGRVDYDLAVPILYDFTYQDVDSGGVVKDRNGNAIVVSRLSQIQRIFSHDERVWIILNREKFRSRKKNLRWEYPGAREELFIRQNCQLKFRSYLWHVYLWDRNQGRYSNFRKERANWVE